MKNANQSAAPIAAHSYNDESQDMTVVRYVPEQSGLTKREHFAGLAMQSLIANPAALANATVHARAEGVNLSTHLSGLAVAFSDSLLEELEK